MVFQLLITRISTVIASEFLYGFTCPLSEIRAHGATAIEVIQSTSTGFAVWGCLLLESRLHPIMHEHLAQLKLICFKAIVGFDAVQEIVFPVLAQYGVFKPSPPWRVSWNDFAIGVPQFLLVVEMVSVHGQHTDSASHGEMLAYSDTGLRRRQFPMVFPFQPLPTSAIA